MTLTYFRVTREFGKIVMAPFFSFEWEMTELLVSRVIVSFANRRAQRASVDFAALLSFLPSHHRWALMQSSVGDWA